MAKKKTKLEKMSKKERTSLAYALATNLAKQGKPQTPKNERKLTKGEINKKEKHMGKFKKAFSLEEIQKIKEELKNPKKADLNKDGKLSSYEKKRGAAIEKTIKKEDLDVGHQDNEPRMLKADLYRIAKYASELYLMVDQFDDIEQEVDFPSWWQSKITLSKDYLVKAKHYLDGQLKVDQIDATLGEEFEYSDSAKASLEKIKNKRAARYQYNQPKKSDPTIAQKGGHDKVYKDLLDKSIKEEDKEYKVLSPSELDKLASLPPTDRRFRKDPRYKGKVEIGDELIMVDRNSPAYGRKGKVVRLTQDGVEVDFGRGDKYGIISRRIKGNKITA